MLPQRNIATDHARTDLLFLLDVDFVPCRKLKKLISTELWTTDVAKRAQDGELTIVPAFKITLDVAMPSEQAEVLAQVRVRMRASAQYLAIPCCAMNTLMA